MTVIAPQLLEQVLEGLSRSTTPNTTNKGMGNNARDRFNKMNICLFNAAKRNAQLDSAKRLRSKAVKSRFSSELTE
jgi:hypothetical protein